MNDEKSECCGARIIEEERPVIIGKPGKRPARVVVHGDFCSKCHKGIFDKPIKEGEDKTYKSLKLFIGPREAHDD